MTIRLANCCSQAVKHNSGSKDAFFTSTVNASTFTEKRKGIFQASLTAAPGSWTLGILVAHRGYGNHCHCKKGNIRVNLPTMSGLATG